MNNRRTFFQVLAAGVASLTLPQNKKKYWPVPQSSLATDGWNCHICPINVSVDLGREEIRELGKKGPYFRTVKFPIGV